MFPEAALHSFGEQLRGSAHNVFDLADLPLIFLSLWPKMPQDGPKTSSALKLLHFLPLPLFFFSDPERPAMELGLAMLHWISPSSCTKKTLQLSIFTAKTMDTLESLRKGTRDQSLPQMLSCSWHVHGGKLEIGMLEVRLVLALLDVLELLNEASVVLLVQDVVRIVLELLQAREGRLVLELQDQEVKLVLELLHAEIRFVLERLRRSGKC